MNRLTPTQQKLLDHLQTKGKDHRKRWVRSFLPGTKTRTIISLLRRGLIEERFVQIPRKDWPKDRDPMTVGYNYQELRVKKG